MTIYSTVPLDLLNDFEALRTTNCWDLPCTVLVTDTLNICPKIYNTQKTTETCGVGPHSNCHILIGPSI